MSTKTSFSSLSFVVTVIAHPQRGTVNLLKNVRSFQNAIAAHFLLSSVQHCRLLQHVAANATPSRPLKYRQYRLTAGLDAQPFDKHDFYASGMGVSNYPPGYGVLRDTGICECSGAHTDSKPRSSSTLASSIADIE